MMTDTRSREVGRATSELSLLVDIGSAWTKAAVVGRALGRWRIAAHTAQPSGWDEAELVAAYAQQIPALLEIVPDLDLELWPSGRACD